MPKKGRTYENRPKKDDKGSITLDRAKVRGPAVRPRVVIQPKRGDAHASRRRWKATRHHDDDPVAFSIKKVLFSMFSVLVVEGLSVNRN